MFFKDIDFKPGNVKFDAFDIDPDKSFNEQQWSYKQDMFQVSYDGKYTIDIGWLPDHNPNGKFNIVIIKDYDWENPIFYKKTKNLKTLYKYVEECAELVRRLLNGNQPSS